MYPAQSIIDDRAVDPHAAQAALDRLQRRIRDSLRCAVAALVAAATLLVLGQRTLVLPLAIGALAGAIVAALTRSDRQALLVRLVGQRSAYAIPEVARAAERLATPAMRHELARSVVRVVLEAEGLEPRNPMGYALPDRVSAHADDLLSVAYLLAQDGVRVHPATMALLNRLLSSPARSPLFNPQVPEQHLAMALQRVRCSMES
jgi:hypothetical protein